MSEISLQHAERILTSVRQFQAVLKVVRARELFAGEGVTVRAKLKKHSDWNRYSSGRQDQLEMIHVKLNRIESVRAEHDALVKCLPLTKKLFGETLYDVIDQLVKIYEELEKHISQDCHIAIFSDKNQSFLKNGVQPGKKNSVLNPENNPLYSVYDLKRVIRSNALIAKFAADFIEEKVEYKASSSFPIEIVIAESEAALIETADNTVINLIEQEGWLQGEIALILIDRRTHTEIKSQFSRKPRWDLLHLRNEIISTTSLGIKGLEREVAVVIINNSNNSKGRSITNKRKIYTAITRAKLKLVIVCTQTTADELFTGKTRSD